MTGRTRLALVGDFNEQVVAHRAINESFALANAVSNAPLVHQWVGTETIVPGQKRSFQNVSGIWVVPASPYRNTEGALWAIQYARTQTVPFLGTCGGYQHTLLEFARNVLKLEKADHAENNPATPLPLLERMHCSLIEQVQRVSVTSDDFHSLYGGPSGLEGYHCSYGLNPRYTHVFEGTPMEIVARSDDGQPRAFQLRGHPFYVGTQFQPERRALSGSLHPLVAAFFKAATNARQQQATLTKNG